VHATLESEEERVAGRGGDGGGGEGEPVHTGGYSAEAEIARIERGGGALCVLFCSKI
jgi:hypothetical protein